MYNYFGYFLTVYLIVFGVIFGWFFNQIRLERQAINETSKLNES